MRRKNEDSPIVSGTPEDLQAEQVESEKENQKDQVAEEEAAADAGQLSLFGGAWSEHEENVLNKLKKLDVLNLTPS